MPPTSCPNSRPNSGPLPAPPRVGKALACIALCLWFAAGGAAATACTLWGAAGDRVRGGGVLVVKNRDWKPDHQQTLKLVEPGDGYKYLGLFAPGGVRAGVNEKGLVVLSATAGSIPRKARQSLPRERGLNAKLLKHCATVDEALASTAWLRGPRILLLADPAQMAVLEIGPKGEVAFRRCANGALWASNHYQEPKLAPYNPAPGSRRLASSRAREKRIRLELSGERQYSLADFIKLSRDTTGGPNLALWRTGKTQKSTRTLSSFIVYLPPQGRGGVFVRLANPGRPQKERTLELEQVFAPGFHLPSWRP